MTNINGLPNSQHIIDLEAGDPKADHSKNLQEQIATGLRQLQARTAHAVTNDTSDSNWEDQQPAPLDWNDEI